MTQSFFSEPDPKVDGNYVVSRLDRKGDLKPLKGEVFLTKQEADKRARELNKGLQEEKETSYNNQEVLKRKSVWHKAYRTNLMPDSCSYYNYKKSIIRNYGHQLHYPIRDAHCGTPYYLLFSKEY